jgi:hypothetical protein
MNPTCSPDNVLAALLLLRHVVPGEHPEISQQTAAMWHVAVGLYPAEVVEYVAVHWAGERFPSREEFREAVSAEQRARRDAAARRALEHPQDHPRCPECDGFGWRVVSTSPFWVVDECPRGCEIPLPRFRQEPGARRRSRGPAKTTGPQKVQREVIETTGRITGERGDF